MKKYLIIAIILILLVIDLFEFHDLFEPKTLPEFLTGLVSIPIIILLGIDLLRKKN
jgi:hypothetical protein